VVVHNTVAVNVSGIDDASIVDAVRHTVRVRLGHLVGSWHVKISASEDSRHWDLHLRGAFGHHVANFLSEPSMPDAVDRRLRAFLCAVAPPLSLPRGRPRNSSPVIRLQHATAGAPESRTSSDFLVSTRIVRQWCRLRTSRHGVALPSCVDATAAIISAAARHGGGRWTGRPLDGAAVPLPN
jgi:hypothetical protein